MYAIWNLTNKCPWDCEFCCVSAKQALAGRKAGLTEPFCNELDLASKMEILYQLIANGIKIDFSGGDPLYFEDDYTVISKAADNLPKTMINVSTTGVAFNDQKIDMLRRVGKVELTLDNLDSVVNSNRPKGYNASSMRALKKLVSAGIRCSAVTILYPLTMTRTNLTGLHQWLCDNKIPQWDIIKFIPVGRGVGHEDLTVTEAEYLETMRFIEGLGGPVRIAFQHSLKMLAGTDSCRAVHESIGILPDGTVISCGWALDENGQPLEGFRLGKLPEEDLGDILKKTIESPIYRNRPTTCRILSCQACGG